MDGVHCTSYTPSPVRYGSEGELVADYVNLLLEMSRLSFPARARPRPSPVSPPLLAFQFHPCLFVQREIRAQRWKPRWVGSMQPAAASTTSIQEQDRKAIVFRAVPKIAALSSHPAVRVRVVRPVAFNTLLFGSPSSRSGQTAEQTTTTAAIIPQGGQAGRQAAGFPPRPQPRR